MAKYSKKDDSRTVKEKYAHDFLLSLLVEKQEHDAKTVGYKLFGIQGFVPRSWIIRNRRRSKFGDKKFVLTNLKGLRKAIDDAEKILKK